MVVTIIILLILAGVTLNIALSDNGLFSKSKKAAEEYDQAQSEEEDLISQFATQMYSEYVGAEVEGYELSSKTVTIDGTTSGVGSSNKDGNGNTIDGVENDGSQKFTTEDMTWRVWDFDGNTLRIIGDLTSQKLTLKGAAGYNNGVWALDNICNTLYSDGKKGVEATNLKRTDIQKVSTYDYTKYKHKSSGWTEITEETDDNDVIYFGESKNYATANRYPEMWNINDKGWTYEYNNEDKKATGKDKECKEWEEIVTDDGKMGNQMSKGDNNTTFKQSYYAHEYKQNEFINDKYYDLIFIRTDKSDSGAYWLAGRYVLLHENNCSSGLENVYYSDDFSRVAGDGLLSSDSNGGVNKTYNLRPIVSINLKSSGCKMTEKVGNDGVVTYKLDWNEV